jgi:hypothetical protein
VGKRVVDAAVVKKAADNAVVAEGSTAEVATQRTAESSPTPELGAKRVTISGGSTPPTKRPFRGS